jgi:glycosyltransferase involved in cell wall biosynthesis
MDNKEIDGIKLVIAGEKGWKSAQIFRDWNNSPYRKDIIFTDYVDKYDKIYLYNLAEIFIFPSFYEGFGFPPLESMACGTPAIVGCYTSLPEVASNSALMVDPKNYQSIAEAMGLLLFNSRIRCEFIARGIETAKKFNWGTAAKEYLKAFFSISSDAG